jgi:hypothetical protein
MIIDENMREINYDISYKRFKEIMGSVLFPMNEIDERCLQ